MGYLLCIGESLWLKKVGSFKTWWYFRHLITMESWSYTCMLVASMLVCGWVQGDADTVETEGDESEAEMNLKCWATWGIKWWVGGWLGVGFNVENCWGAPVVTICPPPQWSCARPLRQRLLRSGGISASLCSITTARRSPLSETRTRSIFLCGTTRLYCTRLTLS